MKPEFRLFLLDHFIINPPPPPKPNLAVAASLAAPLVALFAPKLIEMGLGAIATWLKKAGEDKTEQVSGSEFRHLYVTDDQQRLHPDDSIKCLIGVYGVFANEDRRPTPPKDMALLALEKEGLVPPNADIAIVFEAAVVRMPDDTAFYLETRHFSVREFIGDGRSDRTYVATLAVSTPSATTDGTTIAIGNVLLGRVARETLPIPAGQPLGQYPRYRSNLMPWNQITSDAKAAYDSDVKRGEAKNRSYMPVTFNLTLSETADGNKFLAKLGELLEGAKGDAAKEISEVLLPDREKAAKEAEDAAEKLYTAEEDAIIAVKEAEAALVAGSPDQRAVLEAKLAKAKRALAVAERQRKAAGLPDLP